LILTGRYPCGWLNIPADEYSAATFSVQDIQRSPDVPFFHLRCAKMSMVKLCEATIYHSHLLVLFGPTHIQTGPEGVGCLSPPGSLLQTSAEVVFCFTGPCASGSGWAAHPMRTRVSRKETKEPTYEAASSLPVIAICWGPPAVNLRACFNMDHMDLPEHGMCTPYMDLDGQFHGEHDN